MADETPPVDNGGGDQQQPAVPPRWSEVEALDNYQQAPPEKQLVIFDRWHNAAYNWASQHPEWSNQSEDFNKFAANKQTELSKAAGDLTPEQARVKLAVQAIEPFSPQPLPPVPGEPPAAELPPAPEIPDLSLQSTAGWKTNAQAIREAVYPLPKDIKDSFYKAQIGQAQAEADKQLKDAQERKGPAGEQISAEPGLGNYYYKGDIAGFAGKAYEDFRHEFAPLLGVTEKEKSLNMIPWGKNPDGSTRYEYHPLGATPNDTGLLPLIQNELFVNPMTVATAAGMKPENFFYEHRPTDSTAASYAKGSFNAAQGLLMTLLTPGMWMGLGPSEGNMSKIISAGFGEQMLSQVKPHLEDAFTAKTPGQALEGILNTAVDLAMGGIAAKHAVHSDAVIEKHTPELSDRLLQVAGGNADLKERAPEVHAAVMDELTRRGLEPMNVEDAIKNKELAQVAPETAKAVQTVPQEELAKETPESVPKPETPVAEAEKPASEAAPQVPAPPETLEQVAERKAGELRNANQPAEVAPRLITEATPEGPKHTLDIPEGASIDQLRELAKHVSDAAMPSDTRVALLKEIQERIQPAEAKPKRAPTKTPEQIATRTAELRDELLKEGTIGGHDLESVEGNRFLQKEVGKTGANVAKESLRKELEKAYPPEPVPEGAKETTEKSEVPKFTLPMTTDADGKITPRFTNKPREVAAHLNAGNDLFVPEGTEVNPRIQTKALPDGREQVVSVDLPKFGEVKNPGDLTKAYKENPKVQEASEAQTGGKTARELTPLKKGYRKETEKLGQGGPITEAEGVKVVEYMKDKGLAPGGKIFQANEKRGLDAATIYDAQKESLLRFFRKSPEGLPEVDKLQGLAENLARQPKPGEETLPPESETLGVRGERIHLEEEKMFEDILKEHDPDLKPNEVLDKDDDTRKEGDYDRGARPTKEDRAAAKATAKRNLEILDAMGILRKDTPDPFGTALRYIANDPRESPENRALAKAYLDSGRDTSQVRVVRKFRPYNEKSKENYAMRHRIDNVDEPEKATLFINTADPQGQAGGMSGSLLHEAVHDNTVLKLDEDYKRNPTEQAAYENINRAFEAAKKGLRGTVDSSGQEHYGLTNVREFAAEIGANAEFRKALANLPKLEPKKTFLQSVGNWFKELFYGKVVKPGSLLDGAYDAVMKLVSTPVEKERVGEGAAEEAQRASNKDQMIVRELRSGKSVEQVAKENSLTEKQVEDIHDRTIGAKVESNQRSAWRAGISQRMWDERDIPVLPGEVTRAKELTEQGIKDIEEGYDLDKRIADLKGVESGAAAATGEDFGRFRAKAIMLGKETSDLRDKVAKDPSQENQDALQKAVKAELDWANKVKPFSTGAGEALAAHIGANDVDTGNYYDVRGKFVRDVGRTPTEKESAEIQKQVDETQKARTEVADKYKTMGEDIAKELGTKETPIDEDKIVKQAVAQGVKPEDAKKLAKLPIDSTKDLQKYFTDKFEANPPKAAGGNFTPREAAAIWNWVKTNSVDIMGQVPIKPVELFDWASKELGISPQLVREALNTNKTVRNASDALYRAQAQQRAILVANRMWMNNVAQGKLGQYADFAWNFQRSLSVLAHVNAPLTHGLGLIFYPPTWGIQGRNILQTFKAFGDPATHEEMLQNIMADENYGKFVKAGLKVKVGTLDDIAQYQSLWEKVPYVGGLARAGNRGMDVLKAMRMDIANKWYETRLTDAEKAKVASGSKAGDQILQELMTLVNHSTGTTDRSTFLGGLFEHPNWRQVFFAPRLESARWQDVVINPARMGALYAKGAFTELTPAEKMFRRLVLRQNAFRAATYFALLGANEIAIQASGDKKDKINWLDPSKADWLAFKAHGQTIISPSSFLSPLRISLATTVSQVVPAENRSDVADKLLQYALGKVNPVFTDLLEIARGKQAYTGRPLPWKNAKEAKFGEAPKTPLKWYEYALAKAPIPIAQTAQEHFELLREHGVGSKFAKVFIGDSIAAAASIAATHVHPAPPEKPGKRVTLKDWKHPFKKKGGGKL
jgi:hypothetical protein